MDITINQNGIFFCVNNRFVNPNNYGLKLGKDYQAKSYKLVNSFLDIKESENYYVVNLLKKENTKTNNIEWKNNNPYQFLFFSHSYNRLSSNTYPTAVKNMHENIPYYLTFLDLNFNLISKENLITMSFRDSVLYFPKYLCNEKHKLLNTKIKHYKLLENYNI